MTCDQNPWIQMKNTTSNDFVLITSMHFTMNVWQHVLFLCLLSKSETTCDDVQSSDPPRVMKIFNRSLLFDCVSRADAEALEGLLEYLQSQEKRLTDEEFKGESKMCRLALASHNQQSCVWIGGQCLYTDSFDTVSVQMPCLECLFCLCSATETRFIWGRLLPLAFFVPLLPSLLVLTQRIWEGKAGVVFVSC